MGDTRGQPGQQVAGGPSAQRKSTGRLGAGRTGLPKRDLARPLTLVATQRPLIVGAIKAALGRSPRFVVEAVDLDPSVVDAPAFQSANALLVDVEPAPALTLRLCQEARVCRPALPILVLVCCPAGTAPLHLRALRLLGVNGVLSLDRSPDQVLAAIETVTRGNFALYASLAPAQAAALGLEQDRRRTRLGTRGEERPVTERDIELLGLVKEGFTDSEIGLGST